MRKSLKPQTKKLFKDMDRIFSLAGLRQIKFNDIKVFSDENNLRSQTETQKRMLIRMVILENYLQIDTKMNILITNFFFHHCQNSYKALLKIVNSDEFKVFHTKILNEMPFLRKMATLKKIIDVPKYIISDMNKINDLRNAIAHSLVPERLENSRTIYKRRSIFSIEGVEVFEKDTEKIMSFLQAHFEQAFDDNDKRLGVKL